MPPFGVDGYEAVPEHGGAEQPPVVELLFAQSGAVSDVFADFGIEGCIRVRAAVVGVALYSEPVERTAHVHLFARRGFYEREVHC